MVNTEEIKKRKEQLENALFDVNLALQNDEYKNPFVFKRMDTIKESHLHNHHLKKICNECIKSGSGFDPSLITQHIEHIALDRFNKIVLDEISSVSIEILMKMRHELELLMLRERHDHYNKELIKIEKMLIESVTGVSTDTTSTGVSTDTTAEEIKQVKKGKKK